MNNNARILEFLGNLKLLKCKFPSSIAIENLLKLNDKNVDKFVELYASLLSKKTDLKYIPKCNIDYMCSIFEEQIFKVGILTFTKQIYCDLVKKIKSNNNEYTDVEKFILLFLKTTMDSMKEQNCKVKDVSVEMLINLIFDIHHYYYVSNKIFEGVGKCRFCNEIKILNPE